MTGVKPKPSGKRAEPLMPVEQPERFHDAVGSKTYSEMPMAKPAKLDAEKLTPEMQAGRAMVADAKAAVASAKLAVRLAQSRAGKAAADVAIAEAKITKAVSKLRAEKLTPEEQRRWFTETVREAGTSENEAAFDGVLKQIARKVLQPKA